jgi:hypothetical protein
MLKHKNMCRLGTDTHKINETNRVKNEDLIRKMCAGLEVSPGLKNCAKSMNKNTSNEVNVFKIECYGSYVQLPTEKKKRNKKFGDF